MRLLETIAIALIAVLVVMIALFGRRELFTRSLGAIELYVRLYNRPGGRGWSPGFAQFRGDELRWFRIFSFSPWPRRRLSRRRLGVESRRSPTADEAQLVPAEWVVLKCRTDGAFVELAMPRHTVTGFLSWLESVTPYST
ncbi:hypothetical protein Rhe02_94850 [Rhizocola hellebori]|uniref:DUF2550 family protein n=1 Tax=Rhizocola hellebori TaxID=1392758 RepID=A0A8J3QIB6_9ACTN|nr:DUF2550 domain-containing protein [Rhizocola hellebori]GIH11418.1 hypothetical protein Rhe02_94850 [Rhizocola hellebori]